MLRIKLVDSLVVAFCYKCTASKCFIQKGVTNHKYVDPLSVF